MAWYKTGKVTVTQGQTSVTGTGTKFASNARVGDGFTGPDGRWYEVINIASETVLGIFPAYIGDTVSGSTSYTIAPIQGYNKETADRLRKITDSISDIEQDVAAAQQAAMEASASADVANSASTGATASASAAADSATASETSRAQAVAAKTAAEAAKTAAQTSQTAAEAAKTAAQASQTAAGNSATNASASASAALASQNAAKTSETNAKTSETNSKTSETSAKASETAAAGSQTASGTSASNAAASASAAQTARTGAETARTGSEAAKTAAETARTQAQAAETKAKDWASKPEGSSVETGLYSALHYAAKAKASADSAGTIVGPRLTSIAQAVMAVNDILIADSSTTMRQLSTGATGRILIGAANPADGRSALGLGSASTYDATTVGAQLLTATDAEAVRVVAGINTSPFTTNTDFNTYTKKGSFILPNAADNLFTNAPPGSKALSRGLLVVDTSGVTGFTTQILTLYQAGTQYVRTTGGGSWAAWNRVSVAGDFGLGSENPPLLPDFNADVPTGFYRAYSAGNATPTPGAPPVPGSFAMSVLAMRGLNNNDYTSYLAVQHLSRARTGNVWVGTRAAGGTIEWKNINPQAFGVGDHMNFTLNAPAGTAMTDIVGNGLFACTDQRPSDWKSDGGGGTYPLGFTVQSTAALGLQVAAGNGSNALHYRVRGPSSFLDWRKIYDNANIVGVVSYVSGTPSGAIFEKGTNTNGTYTKFADGTMICRMTATTPDTAWTALGSGYVSANVDVSLPATFATGADMVVFGNDAVSSGMSVNGYILTTNTVRVAAYYPITVGAPVRTLRLVVMGRWYA